MDHIRMLTDFAFPPLCPVCGKVIAFENRISWYEGMPEEKALIHKKCREAFVRIGRERCARCGTPLKEGKLCMRCQEGKRPFEEGRSVFYYEGAAKKAMLGIKYHSEREYCEYFAFAAFRELEDWIREKHPDCLIPVPVHAKRKRERGYNQAEVLADSLSSYLKIPVRKDVLFRKKETKALKELNPEERRMNLMDAFTIGKKAEGKTVLLIDDIYTTGATMDMCAWTLKVKGGAGKVYALSFCAAEGGIKETGQAET